MVLERNFSTVIEYLPTTNGTFNNGEIMFFEFGHHLSAGPFLFERVSSNFKFFVMSYNRDK